MTRVKICGLRSKKDAETVSLYKPDYAGMILSAGYKRSVERAAAEEIRETLDPAIPLVGVFVDEDLSFMESYLRDGVIDIAQLHGSESRETILYLKKTGKEVWKAFQITESSDFDAIEESPADLVLLDAGKGSGETFDWFLAQRVQRPYLLAGGLSPENIRNAILEVHPFGVDVSSGVETEGVKDAEKIRKFISRAREA